MKAILMAAGEGLRVDREAVAKPLLWLNGQTILGRLLAQLSEIGGIEPIVVVGYNPTRFLKMFWDTTGTLYSLLHVSHLFSGGALVGYADVVTTTDALSQIIESPDSTLVTQANPHSRRFALEGGRIVGIAGLDEKPEWRHSFGGFAHFSRIESHRLQRIVGFERAHIGHAVMGFRAVLGDSVNVNTQEDLERARREFV